MQKLFLSAGVMNLRSLRMDAAHGTPTIWEKLAALTGIHKDPAVMAGVARDFNQGERDVVELLQPLFHTAESDVLVAVTTFVKDVLAAEQSVTSVGGAVTAVKSAAQAEGGAMLGNIAKLGETALVTLTSAALSALGHLGVPA